MNSPKISLCMIVRDEERFLERCLSSATSAVDEIVIVDTGSKDNTPKLARQLGARVFQHRWNDDFSEARNRSLEEAQGEWILILDADEKLNDGAGEHIRQAVTDPTAIGFELRLLNLNDNNKPTDEIYILRLFRSHPTVRFQNIIHEQIDAPLLSLARDQHLRIVRTPITILHYGYSLGTSKGEKKRERNLRLFKKQLELNPNDPYSHYKYADHLRPLSPKEADKAIEESFELLEKLPPTTAREQVYGAEVCAFHAFRLLHEEKGQKALQILKRAKTRYFLTPNFYYAMGGIALRQGDPELSLKSFRRCLGYKGMTLPVPVQPGITGPIAHFGMGESLRALGRHREAETSYRLALSQYPKYRQAALALSFLLQNQNRPEEAIDVLQRLLQATTDSGKDRRCLK